MFILFLFFFIILFFQVEKGFVSFFQNLPVEPDLLRIFERKVCQVFKKNKHRQKQTNINKHETNMKQT